jgi:hypothetical protein
MLKRFNWGHGLFVFISLFMASMLYLVSLCFKQNFDLVSKDYFEKEIAYQEQIDKNRNTANLQTTTVVEYNKSASTIDITLPVEFDRKEVNLDVYLYKPDDASLDRKIKSVSSNGVAHIDAKTLKSGLWHVQLSWSDTSGDYYNKTSVFIH